MSENVLIPITFGTEELEVVTIIDLLRRAEIEVIVVGEAEMVTMSRGVRIVPDKLFSEIDENEQYSAIVLPGGGHGVLGLIQNIQLVELVKYNLDRKSLIGAICAAPLFLIRHKLIDESVTITSFPDVQSELNHNNYSEENVVVSGNIVTSRGAGTAIEFSLKIIELLKGKVMAEKVAKDICY